MANSSATRTGGLYRAMLFPKTMSAAWDVRRVKAAASHQVGRRHEAIGVGVMFIDAPAIEAGIFGKFQLV